MEEGVFCLSLFIFLLFHVFVIGYYIFLIYSFYLTKGIFKLILNMNINVEFLGGFF